MILKTRHYIISADAPREEFKSLARAMERGDAWSPRTPVFPGDKARAEVPPESCLEPDPATTWFAGWFDAWWPE